MKKKTETPVKAITAADVLNSSVWKNTAESHLAPLRNKIKSAQDSCKKGERLRRTPLIRLNEMSYLSQETFTAAYACVVAKTPIDLPSALRQAVQQIGDPIFAEAYQKMASAPAEPVKRVKATKRPKDTERKTDHDPYIEE